MKLCFQSFKKNYHLLRILYQAQLSMKHEEKIKIFLDIMSCAELKNDTSSPEDVHIQPLEPMSVPYKAKGICRALQT